MTVVIELPKPSGNFPGANLSADAVEFAAAMAAYQKASHRRFPTWSEVLAVAQALGYRRTHSEDQS